MAVVVLLAVMLATAGLGLWERWELMLYDTWFGLRGRETPDPRIVLVEIDDASIREIGPFVWPRSVHADLITKLASARVVGWDLLLDAPGDPAGDEALARALKASGPATVLASTFTFSQENGEWMQQLQQPWSPLAAASHSTGFINTPTDVDNVVRGVIPADLNTFARPYPSFSLAVTLAYLGLDVDDLTLGPAGLVAGHLRVPWNGASRVLVDFAGPGRTFPIYRYADVLAGRIDPQTFRDKIVLIGPTSPLFHDEYNNPFTRSNLVLGAALPSPGLELHANAIASFLRGRYFHRAGTPLNLLVLLLAGAGTVLATRRLRPWLGTAAMLGMAGGLAAITYWLWLSMGLWLNFLAPLITIALTFTLVTLSNLIEAELNRRRVQELFGRYVPPEVVSELVQHPEMVPLGGQRQEVTVIFSDIRGFTSYSEGQAPETVVARLNEYFTAMTEVIFRHGGTLDKYLGDGLMALFGAPVPSPHHARQALKAAGEMLTRVEELNQTWAERGEKLFRIGIGINSGPVLVGNIGSPRRLEYTAIGEEVNLASRLESLNKEFKTSMIISERTLACLEQQGFATAGLRELGTVAVRGLEQPVKIFTAHFSSQEGGEDGDRAEQGRETVHPAGNQPGA